MPLAFLIVPVVADPSVTVPQLLHQKVYDVFGYISPTWNLDPGVAAYIRSAVALAAIPAAIVLARFLPTSRRQGAALVVWTVAMLFALRVFEPELFPYFLAPTLALAPISAARLPWWRLASVCAPGRLAHLVAAHRRPGQVVALAHPGRSAVPARMAGLPGQGPPPPGEPTSIGESVHRRDRRYALARRTGATTRGASPVNPPAFATGSGGPVDGPSPSHENVGARGAGGRP